MSKNPPQLQIITCEQGSDEWFKARLGIPTASCFNFVCAERGPRGGDSSKERIGRRTYMYKLVGERITGKPKYEYNNDHMERGKEMEQEARDWYAFTTDLKPVQVGFLRRGDVGCSPDSLIDKQGMLEIKTKLPHCQIETLLDGTLPTEHVKQVQGQLWVAAREWCDFVSYWPDLPGFRVRVHRDEQVIAKIKVAVDQFLDEMYTLEQRIRGMAA